MKIRNHRKDDSIDGSITNSTESGKIRYRLSFMS